MMAGKLAQSVGVDRLALQLDPMRWWHLDGVVALEQVTFGSGAWTLAQFYAELAAPGRWLQVLTDGVRVLGYVDVAVTGRDSDLMTIAVATELRGQGWGAQMLESALGAAAHRGADVMFLEVRADNPARILYEQFGFVRIDTRRDYYGRGEHALVMRRRLIKEQREDAGLGAAAGRDL